MCLMSYPVPQADCRRPARRHPGPRERPTPASSPTDWRHMHGDHHESESSVPVRSYLSAACREPNTLVKLIRNVGL